MHENVTFEMVKFQTWSGPSKRTFMNSEKLAEFGLLLNLEVISRKIAQNLSNISRCFPEAMKLSCVKF